MVTRAKRASNNKWDAANMVVLGCKIRRDEAEAFRAACRQASTTPSAVFHDAIREFLEQHNNETPESQ